MLKGTQIKVIKQNIEVIGENNKKQSKEYIVGCRHKECNIHKIVNSPKKVANMVLIYLTYK